MCRGRLTDALVQNPPFDQEAFDTRLAQRVGVAEKCREIVEAHADRARTEWDINRGRLVREIVAATGLDADELELVKPSLLFRSDHNTVVQMINPRSVEPEMPRVLLMGDGSIELAGPTVERRASATPKHSCDLCGELSESLQRRFMIRGHLGAGGVNPHHSGAEDLCPRCHRRERFKTISFVAFGALVMIAIVAVAIVVSI